VGIVRGLPGERAHKSRASATFRFCAIGGVAALAAGLMVLSSTRPVVEKAKPLAPLIATERNNDSSQAAAKVTGQPDQTAKAKEPVLLPEPLSVTPTAASSPPSRAANAHAEAALVTELPVPSPPAMSVEANAVPVSGAQSLPPPVPAVDAREAPSEAAPVTELPVPTPPATSVEANAAPVWGEQSLPPPVPAVDAGEAPSSGPSLPASLAANAQAEAAPVTELPSPTPPATSVEANAAPVSGEQSLPPPVPAVDAGEATSRPSLPASQAAITVSGSKSSPSQMAGGEIRQGPVSGLQSPRAQGTSTILQLNHDEIVALINHAKDFLKNGDFATARLLLRRAAEAGSADATLMLGETFDPLVMHERGAIGIAPDIAQASQWYEKAAKLGSDVAARRLAKLAQSGH
jgi:Sel1 repeat